MKFRKSLTLKVRILLPVLLLFVQLQAQNLKLHYNPELDEMNSTTITDATGNANGTLKNGAKISTYKGKKVIGLGAGNGYVDMGSGLGETVESLNDFSIFCQLYIPTTTNLSGNGNFIWTFANSNNIASAANGCLFFSAKNTRYAISPTNWTRESGIQTGAVLSKGSWKTVTYVQKSGRGELYIDGELVKSGNISMNPSGLGKTAYNYLGRSCYAADAYLKNALFSDFRIYQGAISAAEIADLSKELAELNRGQDSLIVTAAMEELAIDNPDSIRSKIPLQNTVGDNVAVSWVSSDAKVVASDGTVIRPTIGQPAAIVRLTATLKRNSYEANKQFMVMVLPVYSDEKSVDLDLANLQIGGNVSNARSQVSLPYKTAEGSKVNWSSGSPEFINAAGKVLQLSPLGKGKKEVLLTATVTKGNISKTKAFTIHIAEKEDRDAYLFAYFTGNAPAQEQIRFALSNDGYIYTPLNNGNPVINSADIALKKSVRDPHILRCEDGKTFYMVVTDMRSNEGWASNRGMVLLKSTDLVNWTSSAIHFPTKWPTTMANVTRVWAPQTIYDHQAGKYMVYFSLLTNDGTIPYDKVFYCYANEDFTDLEGEPKYLFDRGSATIDGDIVFNEVDQKYHMFFKNEGIGGISKVTSTTLTPQDGALAGSQWKELLDNVDQTNEAVEGAGVFRLIDTDNWILMYDCYGAGHYQFCSTPDLEHFSFVRDNYEMDARHGTTISISKEEAQRLVKAFPSTALNNLEVGARSPNIREKGFTVDKQSKALLIPVFYGVDLAHFDPEVYATPGAEISPKGAQDFSKGAVKYSFKLNNVTTTYDVSVNIEANPVLPDFHADPEVLYSEQTGKFYIYPTTDGYAGWGGYSFDVFSSPDLVNWTNEGTFLDLSTLQVSWASGNAWAPCIEEIKLDNGQYRYYYYFSGESGGKKIGVAVSDHPTGPFTDSGAPMIGELPAGVGGQNIDGDVFTDPVSGKSYFYWGNGFAAVAELNDDMISIKKETTKVITPQGGNLQTYAFREGVYVFYRNGLYYFLWSVDDTGSPNYHVAYGTSTSPTGPINVAAEPIVIQQDAANEIYGTAHNSILQIPGRDEWYIVYHRINKNYLNNGPGYHREVCIDRLYFNEDGTIQKVTPTERGIDPVHLNSVDTSTKGFFLNKKKQKGK